MELKFPKWLWIVNLDFVFFKSQALFTILIAHVSLYTSLIPYFSKKLKTTYILRLKQGLNTKNPMKKVYKYRMN